MKRLKLVASEGMTESYRLTVSTSAPFFTSALAKLLSAVDDLAS